MNLCRRVIMASGSFNHLWKKVAPLPSCDVYNYRLSKVVAAPFSTRVETSSSSSPKAAAPIKPDPCDDGASASAEKSKAKAKAQREKRKVFQKLKCLTVDTIDLIIKDEEKKGVSVTQEDLFLWAKRLKKEDKKFENALEIFRWMERKKMKFSPRELALYVDLIARVKNAMASADYFDKVDPDFNALDPDAKNWLAYWRLTYWFEVIRINSLAGFHSPTPEEEARCKRIMPYEESYHYIKHIIMHGKNL